MDAEDALVRLVQPRVEDLRDGAVRAGQRDQVVPLGPLVGQVQQLREVGLAEAHAFLRAGTGHGQGSEAADSNLPGSPETLWKNGESGIMGEDGGRRGNWGQMGANGGNGGAMGGMAGVMGGNGGGLGIHHKITIEIV